MAGIGRSKRYQRAAVYRAKSTKRCLALYTVTVDVNRVYDKARRYAEDNRTGISVRGDRDCLSFSQLYDARDLD